MGFQRNKLGFQRNKQLMELVVSKLSEEGIPCFFTLAWNVAIDRKVVDGSEEVFLIKVKQFLPPDARCYWEQHGSVYSWLVVDTCSP